MTAETIHTCSYSCERPECIRAQRDELASRLTAETSNAREPDVAMALHWIDRYAAGIDDECQIDLVADALGVTLPDGYATAPPPADARGDVPYDRELIAQMLDAAEAPAFTMEEMDTQARLLREAAQAKPEARGVVDGILDAVRREIERATAKFPTWPTDPLHACGVVQEESGELAKAVLQAVYEPHKSTPEDVVTEAFQTAAMAIRFLASMDRYDWKPGEQHEQGAALTEARNVR